MSTGWARDLRGGGGKRRLGGVVRPPRDSKVATLRVVCRGNRELWPVPASGVVGGGGAGKDGRRFSGPRWGVYTMFGSGVGFPCCVQGVCAGQGPYVMECVLGHRSGWGEERACVQRGCIVAGGGP